MAETLKELDKASSSGSRLDAAIGKLREARELVKGAGAERAADSIRRAIKSTEGAARHASREQE
jgi:hypothetical protein